MVQANDQVLEVPKSFLRNGLLDWKWSAVAGKRLAKVNEEDILLEEVRSVF